MAEFLLGFEKVNCTCSCMFIFKSMEHKIIEVNCFSLGVN